MGFFEVFSAALAGFYALVPSLGLAIILLTFAVRLLLLPLSIKQTRSMREMQNIQPEVKKIQAKNKGNRQKMNEELMALYKEHNVNPFGGCLPLLMQFPVLIGLFYVIRFPLKYMGYAPPRGTAGDAVIALSEYVPRDVSGILETIQQSRLADDLIHRALQVNQFLGLRLDCSSSAVIGGDDPLKVGEACGSGLLSAAPYLILVALMGFTTWYQQKQMQGRQDQSSPQAQQMQMFARIMPVMLMFFAFTFPTGVVLYWLTTNIWTIGQQRLMFRVAPPVEAGGKPPATRKGGGGDGRSTATPGRTARARPGGPPPGDGQKAPAGKPHPSSKKKKKR